MRLSGPILLAAIAIGAPAVAKVPKLDPRTATYELRTYYAAPGKIEALRTRFRDHTLKLFKKHGMVNVAYWNEQATPDMPAERLIYVLAYPSRTARDAAWQAFLLDPEWQRVSATSATSGKLVTKVDSVFMTMADFSPSLRFSQ